MIQGLMFKFELISRFLLLYKLYPSNYAKEKPYRFFCCINCIFIDLEILKSLFSFSFFIQIRTLELLRSRFDSIPGAFNACLVPTDQTEKKKSKGLKATFSRRFDQVLKLSSLSKYLIDNNCH